MQCRSGVVIVSHLVLHACCALAYIPMTEATEMYSSHLPFIECNVQEAMVHFTIYCSYCTLPCTL